VIELVADIVVAEGRIVADGRAAAEFGNAH
jgi:hypothetical protein